MNFTKHLLPDYIRHVVFRKGTEGIMMILVSKKTRPTLDDLVEQVTEKFSIIKTIIANINTKETNKILGDRNKILYGTGKILDRMLGIEYTISSNSFYQINKEQTRYLYMRIAKMANLKGKEIVYDLYCGIGSIGLYLARRAKKVVGVEAVYTAVRDARANARHNEIKNIKFVHGKAEKVAGELVEKHGNPDVIVVDPPRKGCDENLLDTIINLKPKKVIYVSCNPATLARDLKVLCGGGYYPGKVQPVDMFPFTSHVETVVMLKFAK
jgi:23S rRNA (uracil1939-C5)-methyltransferase